MANDRESIIRKLKKLKTKAEGAEAIGSEEEAKSFAAMVQKLLAEYKVDEAEILVGEDQAHEEIVDIPAPFPRHGIPYKSRRSEWGENLASCVAWAHYCRILTSKRSTNAVWFVGKKTDAEVAGDVFCKLLLVSEAIAEKEYVKFFYQCKEKGIVRQARGFKQSFLLGFVRRLSDRYWQQADEIRAYYASNMQALVVLNDARKIVDDWIKQKFKVDDRPARPAERIKNRAGFALGMEKATEVPLSGAKEIA